LVPGSSPTKGRSEGYAELSRDFEGISAILKSCTLEENVAVVVKQKEALRHVILSAQSYLKLDQNILGIV
jgi:hypothetical protein